MSGFWIGLGLFCLGWWIFDGCKHIADAIKEKQNDKQ